MSPNVPTRPSLLLSLRDLADQRAWSDFVELYTPLVFGHCVRRGLQEADAEDVTQEVMKAAIKAIPKLTYDPGRGTFRAWLRTVTRSKLNNFFTSRARHPVGTGETGTHDSMLNLPGLAADADAVWESEYRQRLFEVAAGRVQPEFQPATWSAFWWTAIDNRAVAEVAATLQLTAGAVYIARSRVLARLREEVARLGDEGEAADPVQ